MTTEGKVANDATASVSGTIFQICVALEQAFLLEEGQKLWIEKYGDVTVSGQAQIETKLYSDALTDNHANFWNTLKNWLLPEFNYAEYAALVLLTTQPIGPSSRLLEWNDATPNKRLEILKAILKTSSERFLKGQKSKKGKASPPQSLLDQRFVLDSSRRKQLEEILPKISISSASPGINDLRKKILDRYGKTILRAKGDDFLNDLMGHLICPSKIQHGWEITFEDFSEKLTIVSGHYRRDTVFFPAKYCAPDVQHSPAQLEPLKEKRFVRKLYEIQHQNVISEAMRHYLAANLTVIDEFKNYGVDPAKYLTYESNLKQAQQSRHRAAKRRLVGDPVSASQNFYDDLTGESPQPFPNFEQTPIEFRNGVFHMLADDESDHFQWKLWE